MAATPAPPPQTVARSGERRLLLFAVVCALVLAGIYLLMVRTDWGQRLDDAALHGRTTRATVVRATDRLLNTVSVSSLIVAGTAIELIGIARRRPHLAVTAAGVIVGANLSTQLLKRGLGRPDLVGPSDPLGASFPSGHSTVALSLALALVLVVPSRVRGLTALAGFTYAALVGTGTVTAGWHRPSDVIGGYLVATAWTALGATAVIIWRGAVAARGTASRIPVLPPVLIGIGLALLIVGFLGFAATLIADRQNQLDVVRLDDAYAIALVSIVGAGLLLLAVLLIALRGVDLDPTDEEERVARVALAGS